MSFLRLRPDNFTPPQRTPWGGRKIVEEYKAGLGLNTDQIVGESWEISVEPSFHSRVSTLPGAPKLSEVLRRDPVSMLGKRAARDQGATPMLVKLLDAAKDLSVQVHPADDFEGLDRAQSGKPESWLVLDAEPGAGLYLGFAEGVGRRQVSAALESGADLAPLLHFEPVSPGDVFVIQPGLVHAIGAGVTLAEPQLVRPGKRGQTYRFFDWNRRYDEAGRLCPDGLARPLHVLESLAVTRFDLPTGARGAEAARSRPYLLKETGGARLHHLAQLEEMRIERLEGQGAFCLEARETLVGVVVLAGRLEIEGRALQRGEAAVIPACAGPLPLELQDAEVLLTWMAP